MNNFLDIFFPEKCLICGRNISFTSHKYPHFCNECLAELKEIWREDDRCYKCGMPLGQRKYSGDRRVCERCKKENYSFEYNTSLYRYGGENYNGKLFKKVFSLYKFSNRKRIAHLFADRVGEFINSQFALIPVVPVPGRGKKLRKLGWDHVGFVANLLSRNYGIYVFSLLKRAKNIKPQKKLDSNKRKKNVKGAFSIDKREINKFLFKESVGENKWEKGSVILFDDIFTTGATVEECSRVLKQAGFERVFVVTIGID